MIYPKNLDVFFVGIPNIRDPYLRVLSLLRLLYVAIVAIPFKHHGYLSGLIADFFARVGWCYCFYWSIPLSLLFPVLLELI